MYFKNFPTIKYEVAPAGYKTPAKNVALLDITTNIRFKKQILENITAYDYYTVEDGDTLEIISEKLYDSPNYNWLLMLLNDIYDYRSDFLMDQETFDRYIANKYLDCFLNEHDYVNNPNAEYADTTVQYVCSNCGFTTADGRIPHKGYCPDCGLQPPANWWISRYKCSNCEWEAEDGSIPPNGYCPRCHLQPPRIRWVGVHPVTYVDEIVRYQCEYCGYWTNLEDGLYPPEICPVCFKTWEETDWNAQEIHLPEGEEISMLDLIKWKSNIGDRLIFVEPGHDEYDEWHENNGSTVNHELQEGDLYVFNGTDWILFATPEDTEIHNIFPSFADMNRVVTPEKRIIGDHYRVKNPSLDVDTIYEWTGTEWTTHYSDEELQRKVIEHANQYVLHYVDINGYITTPIDENRVPRMDVSPVYAYDYELRKNEEKRQIKVVSKPVLALILKNFKDII